MSTVKELENFKSMCRICLKRRNNMIPLTRKLGNNQDSPSILAAVEDIFPTLINDDFRFPSKVCLICTGHIRTSYNLKRLFNKSQNTIQESISSLEDYLDSLEDSSDLDSLNEENFDFVAQSPVSLTEEFFQRDKAIEFQENLQANEQQESTEMPSECKKIKLHVNGNIFQNISLVEAASDLDNGELSEDNLMTIDEPIMLIVEESQQSNEQDESILQLTSENECTYCQEQFFSENELSQHLMNCKKIELIKCYLCSRKFSSLASKKFHMRMKHSPVVPEIKCEICNEVFKNLQALGYHKRTKHSMKGKRFVCELCGKAFHFRNSLSRHMETHNKDVSKVVCPICGKSFHYKALKCPHHQNNRTPSRTPINIKYFSDDFASHFRMNHTTFESLQQIVGPKIASNRKEIINIATQLLITLWILATPDSFRSVAERFSVSKGTAHYIYVKTIRAIAQLKTDFIKWPSATEIENIKKNIERKNKFPNVVGCIDGMHVNIKAPKESVNRKKTTSLILQGVCNDRLELTDIYFGEVGSLHDSRVFARNPLSQKMTNDSRIYLGINGHLLGDSAYPLRSYLMTPFEDNGDLTDEENLYNVKHSAIRSLIDRTFALLKEKWQRLKYVDASKFEYIVDHMISCCVLHNFVIQHEKVDISEVDPYIEEILDDDFIHLNKNYEDEATRKRNSIAALLHELEYC